MTVQPTFARTVDALDVQVYASEQELGRAAAEETARVLRDAIGRRGEARVIIATGNSQLAFFEALRAVKGVDWSKVRAFHMDEYIGIAETHPASFRAFLRREIINPLGVGAFHLIEADEADPQGGIDAYAEALRRYPPDLCCMGIGENGHLAFNDPPFADFDDVAVAKIVTLDDVSRRQQVREGHFPDFESVPSRAVTLTIPTLVAPARVLAIVPERRKADAVAAALDGPVHDGVPASVLRRVTQATLFLDPASASAWSAWAARNA